MLNCNCTLPYTNPEACKNCPAMIAEEAKNNWQQPFDKDFNPNLIKKVTKTIQKYDENGQFLGTEVITEETELVYTQQETYTDELIFTTPDLNPPNTSNSYSIN